MKKTLKHLGIIAIMAVIGFTMAACTMDIPIPTLGTWNEGNLPNRNSEQWHTYIVAAGTTYYIFIDDRDTHISDTSYADVKLDARYGSRTGTVIGTGVDNWNTSLREPRILTFTASQSGTVYFRVYPYSSTSRLGKYRIAVSTTPAWPAG
jgi:hypothetical protein